MEAHDLLLYWLSERQTVSTATLVEACRRLGDRYGLQPRRAATDRERRWFFHRRLADPLYRLGHIEHLTAAGRWIIVPPVLLWQPGDSGGIGHLYGARAPVLAELLHRRFGDRFRRTPQAHGPEQWALRGECDALALELAGVEELRITVANERGRRLLACLPPLAAALAHNGPYQARSLVQGLHRCVFTPGQRFLWHWEKLPESAVPDQGLYRERGRGALSWVHLHEGQVALLDTSEKRLLAWWNERARAGACVLRYDPVAALLYLSAGGLQPPVLFDRALQLASGNGPALDKDCRWLLYSRIDPERARAAAYVLGVFLETVA